MTTTFNNRRLTHQPMSVGEQEDVNGVYERHGSPQKSVMQMFGENQRLHMARLSVPFLTSLNQDKNTHKMDR